MKITDYKSWKKKIIPFSLVLLGGLILSAHQKTDKNISSSSILLIPPLNDTMPIPCLPDIPYNYISYAITNLPDHYKDPEYPDGVIATADNKPFDNPITNEGAALGRVLFYDKRLSNNNTISCASCHQQAFGFSDPERFSVGLNGGFTGRHAMSLANVRYYWSGKMFWDESVSSLEGQALIPIQDPIEMGMLLDTLVVKLENTSFYPDLFQAAFGSSEITKERIAKAIAQFERSMVSYHSRYDEGMANDPNTPQEDHLFGSLFTVSELRGMALFQGIDSSLQDAWNILEPGEPYIKSIGCADCHQTAAQIISVDVNASPTTTQTGEPGPGPQNIGLEADWTVDPGAGEGRFKVPSLRNIAATAPYMHDGRYQNLEQVLFFYADSVQVNEFLSPFLRVDNNPDSLFDDFDLNSEQIEELLDFLETLTDNDLLTNPIFSDPFCSVSTMINKSSSSEQNINIYPNPFENFVQISCEDCGVQVVQFSVYDMLGNQLSSDKILLTREAVSIPTELLPSGIYLFAAFDEQANIFFSKKLIRR